MITFKQKEYSSRTTKAIFKAKQTGNTLLNAIKLAPKKSKVQIAREAVQVKNNLRPEAVKGKVISGILGASRKIESAITRPGHVVSKGIEKVVSNPVGTITYVATSPLPVPSIVVAPAVNNAVKKRIPAYSRVTTKLGEAWRNSRAARKLENISGYDVSRYVNMIPMA